MRTRYRAAPFPARGHVQAWWSASRARRSPSMAEAHVQDQASEQTVRGPVRGAGVSSDGVDVRTDGAESRSSVGVSIGVAGPLSSAGTSFDGAGVRTDTKGFRFHSTGIRTASAEIRPHGADTDACTCRRSRPHRHRRGTLQARRARTNGAGVRAGRPGGLPGRRGQLQWHSGRAEFLLGHFLSWEP